MSFFGKLDICLYKHVHGRKLMDTKISSLVIALTVASMALTPLILIQNADAASFSVPPRKESPVHGSMVVKMDGMIITIAIHIHQDQVTMLKDIK